MEMSLRDVGGLDKIAKQIRATCIQMSFDAKHGHLKSALSCVDLLVALYWQWLKVSPSTPFDNNRDRFYLSKGHACAALYAVLAARGFIKIDSLSTYARSGSSLPDHPCRHVLPIIEASSGSLGHCLGIAAGALYGLRLDNNPSRAVVLMSDGECNEGSVWEAAMFAAAQKLDRLLAIVDYNGLQATGRSDQIMGFTSLEEKFRSFGWASKSVNGNDISEILACIKSFPFEKGKPSVVIAKTISGYGVSFMEDDIVWHYRVPSNEDLENALGELGVEPLYKVNK